MSANGRVHPLVAAIATELECEPEELGGWIVGVERSTEEGPIFSTIWATVPHWHLRGFVEEMGKTVERQAAGLREEET